MKPYELEDLYKMYLLLKDIESFRKIEQQHDPWDLEFVQLTYKEPGREKVLSLPLEHMDQDTRSKFVATIREFLQEKQTTLKTWLTENGVEL